MIEPKAIQCESSQYGPSMPNSTHNRLLSSPHWPSSIQWTEMKVGNNGTAHGSTKTISSAFTHQPGRTKKPDSRNARNILRLTATANHISVLTTVFRKIESAHNSA